MVTWLTQLVLQARVSMRGVSRVLQLISERLGYCGPIPHWTTGRKWLQRLGHAQLTKPQPQAEDWVWLIDHTVQIGQEKCLMIVGLQLRNLPAPGTSLRQEDLELIALLPRKSWTRAEVCEALEAAVQRTGAPRVIVDDHGVDIAGGVSLFREKHRGTVEIYDMQHKAACLLKQRLEKNPQWIQFQLALTRTRCAIQQTELGFLTPPSPKVKARFMNLEGQLKWACHVLRILNQPPAVVLQKVALERLQNKLGWLNEFHAVVGEWAEWQQLVQKVVTFVNQFGYYSGAVRDLRRILPKSHQHDSSRELAATVLAFVREQARNARHGERLPGSTEILESCFGRFKVLEREQSKGGFTSLVLAFGSLLGKTTQQALTLALQQSPTQAVTNWCQKHLGSTLFSQRRLAYAASATKAG
jgi:hypothetical protein